MAGIGFKLKKMLMEDTYTSIFKAYLFSAVISSGPWLLSIMCLSLLGFLTPIMLNNHGWSIENWDLFGVTIVYIFAFSLITTGVFTNAISRFIADKIYMREPETISSSYISVLLVIVIFQGVSSLIFFSISSNEIFYIVNASSLYVIISCIWIALIYLSASENYKTIIVIFFIGSVISVLAALLGGKYFGFSGFISGFTLGQAVIFFGFSIDVFDNFGFPNKISLEFFSYCNKYYELVLIGIIYYLAIWSDKFIFWFSGTGSHVQGLFYAYGTYDFPIFLSYLTMIPSLAIFLLNIETDFYKEYRSFYEFIMSKKSYKIIHEKKQNMLRIIRHSLIEILKIQGMVTLLVIYFAPFIFSNLNIENDLSLRIFRYTSIGVFFHAYVLIISIILLYFDFRKDVLVITIFFAVSNIALTFLSKNMGVVFYGLGQAVSCILTFVVALLYLNIRLKNLEFLTFSNQPILGRIKDNKELRASPGGGYGTYVDLDKIRTTAR